jgi:hypothetical protein
MADGLQFDKAEFASASAGKVCAVCKTPITDTYFEAVGNILCPTCAARFGGDELVPAALGRAALWGAGVAAAGTAAWYLLLKFTGWETAILAIGIGYFVGKYVRRGSGGRGGAVYQALAMALTYLSIMSSYVLVLRDRLGSDAAAVPVTTLIKAAVMSPFSGRNIIGLIIIGIGLYEAWKLTRKIPISGPFRVAPAGPPPIAEPAPPAGPSP